MKGTEKGAKVAEKRCKHTKWREGKKISRFWSSLKRDFDSPCRIKGFSSKERHEWCRYTLFAAGFNKPPWNFAWKGSIVSSKLPADLFQGNVCTRLRLIVYRSTVLPLVLSFIFYFIQKYYYPSYNYSFRFYELLEITTLGILLPILGFKINPPVFFWKYRTDPQVNTPTFSRYSAGRQWNSRLQPRVR